MASAPAKELTPLQQVFDAVPFSSHASKWDSCWSTSMTPWDRGSPSLALADLLLQRPDLVPPAQDLDARYNPSRDAQGHVIKRTALVPGCGRGYDVLLLASLGYDVWGVDGSEGAIAAAKENEKRHFHSETEDSKNEMWPMPPEDFERGEVHWLVADFFDESWSNETPDQFDLIFDYTFLCALPLEVRPRWASRIAGLVSPHGGRLVCLEFPSSKPFSEPGPPWGVSPEVYEALLSAPGEDISYDNYEVRSQSSSRPKKQALHRLSLIKPMRTHKAGTNEDGSVVDFISVWSF